MPHTLFLMCGTCHAKAHISGYDGHQWHAYTDGELAYHLNKFMQHHQAACATPQKPCCFLTCTMKEPDRMPDAPKPYDLPTVVAMFHRVMGQVDPDTPTTPDIHRRTRRARSVAEETVELLYALVGSREGRRILREMLDTVALKRGHGGPGDLPEIIDACGDLSVVTAGTALECGVNMHPIHETIMLANMAKTGGGRDAYGKFLKPAGWKAPDIGAALRAQGWQEDGIVEG